MLKFDAIGQTKILVATTRPRCHRKSPHASVWKSLIQCSTKIPHLLGVALFWFSQSKYYHWPIRAGSPPVSQWAHKAALCSTGPGPRRKTIRPNTSHSNKEHPHLDTRTQLAPTLLCRDLWHQAAAQGARKGPCVPCIRHVDYLTCKHPAMLSE